MVERGTYSLSWAHEKLHAAMTLNFYPIYSMEEQMAIKLNFHSSYFVYIYKKYHHLWSQATLFLNFGEHSPFYGTTDTPVFNFWWHLVCFSKPAWAPLFTLGGGGHDVCSLRFTSGVTPVNLLRASIVAGRCTPQAALSTLTRKLFCTGLELYLTYSRTKNS